MANMHQILIGLYLPESGASAGEQEPAKIRLVKKVSALAAEEFMDYGLRMKETYLIEEPPNKVMILFTVPMAHAAQDKGIAKWVMETWARLAAEGDSPVARETAPGNGSPLKRIAVGGQRRQRKWWRFWE